MAVVREHPSDLVRDQYLMQVADACGVDTSRLRDMLERPAAPTVEEPRWIPNEPSDDGAPEPVRQVPASTERTMLLLCLHRPETVPAWIEPHMFGDPLLRDVFVALLDAPGDDLAGLLESVRPELADAIGQLAVLPEPEGDPDRIVGLFESLYAEIRSTSSGPEVTLTAPAPPPA